MRVVGQIYRLEPKSGVVKSLVCFLHGYGANGQDLIGLGQEWQSFLPDTAFISPDAPEACAMNPFGGFQWFDLTMRDQHEYWRGVEKAGPALQQFLANELARYGLLEKDMVLIGFSQGTMMALHVGLRGKAPLAGIIGYSGKLAGPEHLAAELTHKAPVLLVHGQLDEVLPVAEIEVAASALKGVGIDVSSHISAGLGHGIDGDGLLLGAEFLRKVL